MSLQFKRNLPTLLVLLAFITLLGATIGGQSITAYSVQAQVPALHSLGQFFSALAQSQLSLFAH